VPAGASRGNAFAAFEAGMLALLGTLALALTVGKIARRMTPAVELLLLLLVALLVSIELASWSGGHAASTGEQIRRLFGAFR